MTKAPLGGHASLKIELIRLGRSIGFEWARHNDDRRIDTEDLQRWSKWLKKNADVNGAVERVSKAVALRLRPE